MDRFARRLTAMNTILGFMWVIENMEFGIVYPHFKCTDDDLDKFIETIQ